ncbi:hypothetical protein L7F22_012362 [Adiantum nelumboides]|nr:hypothetical protein [Adiantum nelumboides]
MIMQPYPSAAIRLHAFELKQVVFQRAVDFAKKADIQEAKDLSSFEFMQIYCSRFIKFLSSPQIDLCFANVDESRELMWGYRNFNPEEGLDFLANYYSFSMVMLGSKGCVASHNVKIVGVLAIKVGEVIDTRGFMEWLLLKFFSISPDVF